MNVRQYVTVSSLQSLEGLALSCTDIGEYCNLIIVNEIKNYCYFKPKEQRKQKEKVKRNNNRKVSELR